MLECFSTVYGSAAESHLRALYRMVSSGDFLLGGVSTCDLGHRCKVSVCQLYLVFEIFYDGLQYPLRHLHPGKFFNFS